MTSPAMESSELSLLSSLRDDFISEDYVQPHYREAYRLAIDRLVDKGRESYEEFLKEERVGSFLSDQELVYIGENAKQLPPQDQAEEATCQPDSQSSSGTYWPMDSDTDAPDLDLGWPQVMHDTLQTNIDLLFHPPRQNHHTIKEVVRKNIQEAKQVSCTTYFKTQSVFFLFLCTIASWLSMFSTGCNLCQAKGFHLSSLLSSGQFSVKECQFELLKT